MAMGLLGSCVLYDLRSSSVMGPSLGSQVLNDPGSSRAKVLKGTGCCRVLSPREARSSRVMSPLGL